MAYFANGSEGMCFDAECATCIYGEDPCPIAWVQMEFNYDCNNKKVRKLLGCLVKDDGTCAMKKLIESKEPEKKFDSKQGSLFKEET